MLVEISENNYFRPIPVTLRCTEYSKIVFSAMSGLSSSLLEVCLV